MTNLTTANAQNDIRTITQLKQAAKERGIIPTGDKRFKSTWINALATLPVVVESTPVIAADGFDWRMQNLKDMWSLKDLKARANTYELVITGPKNRKESYITALGLR